MLNQGKETHGAEGDLSCRPATWVDPLKFLALNCILHAFTVTPNPGATWQSSLFANLLAIFLPFSGGMRAVGAIRLSLERCRSDLERAHKAQALCMAIPKQYSDRYLPLPPSLITVHGRHPVRTNKAWRRISLQCSWPFYSKVLQEDNTPSPYRLVRVPRNYQVIPIPEVGHVGRPPGHKQQTKLACNVSTIRSIASILQICYGSFEIWSATGGQIQKFGYGAYPLVVIPYILMSFLNLVAGLCCASYPAMYLVAYRGEASYSSELSRMVYVDSADGRIGLRSEEALEHGGDAEIMVGDLDLPEPQAWMREVEGRLAGVVGYALSVRTDDGPNRIHAQSIKKSFSRVQQAFKVVASCGFIVAPYLIIYALTGFNPRDSSITQRIATVGSLPAAQILWWFIAKVSCRFFREQLDSQRRATAQQSGATSPPPDMIEELWSLEAGIEVTGSTTGAQQVMLAWSFAPGVGKVVITVLLMMAAVPVAFCFYEVFRVMMREDICVRI